MLSRYEYRSIIPFVSIRVPPLLTFNYEWDTAYSLIVQFSMNIVFQNSF